MFEQMSGFTSISLLVVLLHLVEMTHLPLLSSQDQ